MHHGDENAMDEALTLLIPPDVSATIEPDRGRELSHTSEVFGTQWSMRLVRRDDTDPANDAAYLAQITRACGQTLGLIDAQMSLWHEGSDIAAYNRLHDGEDFELREPFRTVVAKALDVAMLTGGAFNPGLYEAVREWGFGAGECADPVASGFRHAQARAGLPPEIPALNGNLLPKKDGFTLDLNGIAKGYAVDLLCDVVRAHPDTAACLIEIGGELKGFGTRADAMPFWTDIVAGDQARATTYRAALYGWACATSGEAERFHQQADRTFSHILDPQTHASAGTDLIAASVFDKDCAKADALATALIVMGSQRALAFAKMQELPCILFPREELPPILSPTMREWL